MADNAFSLDDLKTILRQAAGEAEDVDLDGDILDTEFEALGYESLALLEASSIVERRYGIVLDEAALGDANTPRSFIGVVNHQLTTSVS